MPRISRITASASFALLLRIFCVGAAAQPPPCYVSFDFGESLKGFLPDEDHALRRGTAQSLADSLSNKFNYWAFQPWDGSSYPKLDVWLEQETNGRWSIFMRMMAAAGLRDEAKLDDVLIDPGDRELSGERSFPKLSEFPGLIHKRFRDRFIDKNDNEIRKLLVKYVPLAVAVVPPRVPLLSDGMQTAGEPRAVLPLQWESYGALAKSKFRIECEWRNGVINIHSVGSGGCRKFPGSSAFSGVVVVYRGWDNEKIDVHLADLSELTPRAIYLEELVFVSKGKCDEPAPAIAPSP
jgi:hypothetical protein